MQKRVDAVASKTEDVDVRTIAALGTPKMEHYLRCIARRIRLLSYLQRDVLGSRRSLGLITTEIHPIVAEPQSSMTA